MSNQIILDIEASGLGEHSYPIEIGVCASGEQAQSWLIQPMDDWTFWDDYAEQNIHRISRQQLNTQGLPAAKVANTLNALFKNETLHVDSLHMDEFWINVLFMDAGIKRAFTVEFLGALLNESQLEKMYALQKEYRDIQKSQGKRFNHHRAGDDAQMILWATERALG